MLRRLLLIAQSSKTDAPSRAFPGLKPMRSVACARDSRGDPPLTRERLHLDVGRPPQLSQDAPQASDGKPWRSSVFTTGPSFLDGSDVILVGPPWLVFFSPYLHEAQVLGSPCGGRCKSIRRRVRGRLRLRDGSGSHSTTRVTHDKANIYCVDMHHVGLMFTAWARHQRDAPQSD
ncbi:hypothetical protein BC628DRAFT_624184 [Trametes gibbosa]|nr:hypothetical protein BC628DRAFT_624184 [Trametes gibbosa]